MHHFLCMRLILNKCKCQFMRVVKSVIISVICRVEVAVLYKVIKVHFLQFDMINRSAGFCPMFADPPRKKNYIAISNLQI